MVISLHPRHHEPLTMASCFESQRVEPPKTTNTRVSHRPCVEAVVVAMPIIITTVSGNRVVPNNNNNNNNGPSPLISRWPPKRPPTPRGPPLFRKTVVKWIISRICTREGPVACTAASCSPVPNPNNTFVPLAPPARTGATTTTTTVAAAVVVNRALAVLPTVTRYKGGRQNHHPCRCHHRHSNDDNNNNNNHRHHPWPQEERRAVML